MSSAVLADEEWEVEIWPSSRYYTEGELVGGESRRSTRPRADHLGLRVHPGEASGLKKADMLIPLGVVSLFFKMGGQHVHQSVVPCLRHPRVQVRAQRVRERPSSLHHLPRV